MGFRWCREMWEGRGGSFGDDMSRRWVRRFEVMTDDRTMGPLAVLFCPGLPAMFTPYQGPGGEFDTLALLRKYDPRQDDDNPFKWWVDCEYSTAPVSGNAQAGQPDGGAGDPGSGVAGGGGGGASLDPTLEPPEWSWDFEETQYAPPKDLDDAAFVNSAGDPLDPPPTVPVGYRVLSYARNQATFDYSTGTYDYAVNNDVFQGYQPGSVLCLPPVAKRVLRGPLRYFRVSYKFKFAPSILGEFIPRRYLDQGFNYLDGGVKFPILVNSFHPAREQLLDGAGGKLAAGAAPKFRGFRVYQWQAFTPLQIILP